MNGIIAEPITSKEFEVVKFVGDNPYETISDIAKKMGIDYKNAHRYCRNLYKKGIFLLTPLPEKNKKGVPVKVSLNIYNNDEDAEYILLNLLKQNKGRMEERKLTDTLNEYQDLIMDPTGREKMALLITLLYGNKHIQREIVITKEGKKFLEEASRKKSLKENIKHKIIKGKKHK